MDEIDAHSLGYILMVFEAISGSVLRGLCSAGGWNQDWLLVRQVP